jgi:hypothetical protein
MQAHHHCCLGSSPLRLQRMGVCWQSLPMQNEAQSLIHRAALACWTQYPDMRAKLASLFKHRSRHGRSHSSQPAGLRDLDVVDARCLSSQKEREGSYRLSTQPGKGLLVTQGLLSSQPKADVEPFSRFIPLIVLQVAMEGAPERHSLLVRDPLDGQIWRWRERGSDGRKIDIWRGVSIRPALQDCPCPIR